MRILNKIFRHKSKKDKWREKLLQDYREGKVLRIEKPNKNFNSNKKHKKKHNKNKNYKNNNEWRE